MKLQHQSLPSTAAQQPSSAPAAFGKAVRLLKHADFERVYKTGRRHFGTHLTMFFVPRAAAGGRVGFTVGRAMGGAVQRNRIKRRLREAVRLHWRELGAAADIVVNPKRSALTADFAELEREIAKAFATVSKKLKAAEARPGESE